MPKHASLKFALVSLLLAVAAAGCSSADAPGDDVEAVSSEDALTSDERAIGEAWNGEEHDDLTPEEEAMLDDTEDPLHDDGPDDDGAVDGELGATSLRPLASCTRTTGFKKGRAMSICTTTINGKAVEQGTAQAFLRMRAAAKRDGVSLLVVSGFRTMAKQRELYRLYKAGRGNLAAPPGYSNHQSGHALDLNARARGVSSWLSRNAATFGFRRTVPSENWHYEKW